MVTCTCGRPQVTDGTAGCNLAAKSLSTDDILVGWNVTVETDSDSDTSEPDTIFHAATLVPDTDQKYNLALSLNVEGCAIVDSQTWCAHCIKEALSEYSMEPKRIVRTKLASRRIEYLARTQ